MSADFPLVGVTALTSLFACFGPRHPGGLGRTGIEESINAKIACAIVCLNY
jgi:hypothetical protein